jgi:hypothetical protein
LNENIKHICDFRTRQTIFSSLLKKYNLQFGCDLYFWSRYGNGASIFTTSGAAARKFQIEIEAGQVRKSFGRVLEHTFKKQNNRTSRD